MELLMYILSYWPWWVALGLSYAILSFWNFREEIAEDFSEEPVPTVLALGYVCCESAIAWPYFMWRHNRLMNKSDGNDQH